MQPSAYNRPDYMNTSYKTHWEFAFCEIILLLSMTTELTSYSWYGTVDKTEGSHIRDSLFFIRFKIFTSYKTFRSTCSLDYWLLRIFWILYHVIIYKLKLIHASQTIYICPWGLNVEKNTVQIDLRSILSSVFYRLWISFLSVLGLGMRLSYITDTMFVDQKL